MNGKNPKKHVKDGDDDPRDEVGDIDLERIQELINELLRNLGPIPGFDAKSLEEAMKKGMIQPQPFIFGFSASPEHGGRVRIQPFGNLQTGESGKTRVAMEREPLVEVIEETDAIVILAELPGVNKEDINLTATARKVRIQVDTPRRKYFKEVEVPRDIVTSSSKARVKNGVLEVRFKKLETPRDHIIPID